MRVLGKYSLVEFSLQSSAIGAVITLILQVRELMIREVKQLVQGHTAGKVLEKEF